MNYNFQTWTLDSSLVHFSKVHVEVSYTRNADHVAMATLVPSGDGYIPVIPPTIEANTWWLCVLVSHA